jgi:beta-glucosidase
VANVLVGAVNPTAKLAITFPVSEADLPHPVIPPLAPEDLGQGNGATNEETHVRSKYSVTYAEGAKVGYKWYEAEHKPVLFPFGYGLSYTTYAYSALTIQDENNERVVSFTVKNTGARQGTETAQVYVTLPDTAREPFKRLVGWQRIDLQPGESRSVSVKIEPQMLSIYDEQNGWTLPRGIYSVAAGPSAAETPLRGTLRVR